MTIVLEEILMLLFMKLSLASQFSYIVTLLFMKEIIIGHVYDDVEV